LHSTPKLQSFNFAHVYLTQALICLYKNSFPQLYESHHKIRTEKNVSVRT